MSEVSSGVRDSNEDIWEANGCFSSIDFENYGLVNTRISIPHPEMITLNPHHTGVEAFLYYLSMQNTGTYIR